MTDGWDPIQYERFKAERSRPFHDLVAGISPDGVRDIADLGCGTGELTASLSERFPAASIIGVDSSAAMLAAAAEHAIDGAVRFEHGDIAAWGLRGQFDVVLANASLQWVPHHAGVLGRWAEALRPGGRLAVQVPYNHDHVAHTIAEELRRSSRYCGYGIDPDPVAQNVLPPEGYAQLLYDLGLSEQHVRLEVYGHELPDAHAVVEWVKGTTLTRFSKVLPAEVFIEFEREYRTQLVAALGSRRPYFYPFKRILFWAHRLGATSQPIRSDLNHLPLSATRVPVVRG